MLALSATPSVADCDDVRVLALNMYHEARGEGPDGMLMVAEVTMNRVASTRYPNTICDVVYQRSQFSWVRTKRDHTPTDRELWTLSLSLAQDILDENIDLFNTGATHFINPRRLTRIPNWVSQYSYVGTIGNHDFYRMEE